MTLVKAGIASLVAVLMAGCAVYEPAPAPRAYYSAPPAYYVPYGSSFSFSYRDYDRGPRHNHHGWR